MSGQGDARDPSGPAGAGAAAEGALVICDACPVRCRIRDGATGPCDRYAGAVIASVIRRTAVGVDAATAAASTRDGCNPA